MPIYNVEKYLPECLDSLIAQTLNDIEIICINDGSTDSSPQIIKRYAKKDSRIIVINKKNSGYGDSMNQGLAKATGEYIAIVESDDYIDEDACENLYRLAKKHNADIVRANYYHHTDASDEIHYSIQKQHLDQPMNIDDDPAILYEAPAIWSAIYRRSFLKKNHVEFLPTPGASYQDTGFNMKALCSAERIVYTDKAYLHYRTDNGNSSVKSRDKMDYVLKEYAEIGGCSTQYVYKLLQTTLQPFVETVDNRKCLKIEVLNTEVANQVANKSTKKVEKFATNSTIDIDNISNTFEPSSSSNEEELKRINKRNEEIIDELREQMKQKDAQIIELSNHIAEQSTKIAELFDNNQKLQLNYQLLLSEGNNVDFTENETQSTDVEIIEDEKPKRKGFFNFFFK